MLSPLRGEKGGFVLATPTYGKGGEGNNGEASTIASGKLAVPAVLWKIIVVLPVIG